MASEEEVRSVVRLCAAQFVSLERRLHDAGLPETAQLVNAASQKLGWEAERAIVKLREQESES